jgi:nucleotide-binding universal stress UspA family protein
LGRATGIQYTLLQIIRSTAELSYGPAGGTVTRFQESLRGLGELEQEESRRATEYLDGLAMRLRSFAMDTRVVWNERPATAMLNDASAHRADLIALATRGRGGLKRLVLGSVADRVLRGANTAILVYRPTDDSASTEQ